MIQVEAPLSDIVIHVFDCLYGAAEIYLDGMVLEERMIECRLFVDVHTIYDIFIWALLISQYQ